MGAIVMVVLAVMIMIVAAQRPVIPGSQNDPPVPALGAPNAWRTSPVGLSTATNVNDNKRKA
jgi:hypothetical protein